MLGELFSYSFIIRALAVGGLVSLCAALLGVSLVLKRFSMIGDGLSHVGFGALAVASVLNIAPLWVAIPVVMLAAFLLLRVSGEKGVKGDAAVAVISSTALAAGVIVTSLAGTNTDLNSYLFGSILAIGKGDVALCVCISAVVLTLYILFYNRIFAVTFDETFARASDRYAGGYTMLLAALTALVVVVGMRLMGTLLISSLIIFPALTSMKLFSTYRAVIISSAVFAVVCFFIGIILSFVFSLPAGAAIVAVNFAAFSIASLIGLTKKR